MAHEIAFDSMGQAEAVFGYGEFPWWHSDSMPAQVLQGPVSFDDIFSIAWPWRAVQEQLQYADGSLSAQHGIRRSDTGAELGVHSGNYGNIQPRDLFDFCAAFFQTYPEIPIAAAIAMQGGAVLNLSARTGAIDVLGSGDITKTYISFLNSYNGRFKATVYMSSVRAVCMNTTRQGLSSADFSMDYRHTKNIKARIASDTKDAARLMAQQQATVANLKASLEKLAQRRLKPQGYISILNALFGEQDTGRTNNIKSKVMELVDDNDGNRWPEWKKTAYGLYQAVTNYVDHAQLVKQTNKTSNMTDDQIRFERAQVGDGAKLKEKALQKILVMADGSECCEDAPIVSMAPRNITPTYQPWAEIVVGSTESAVPMAEQQASVQQTIITIPTQPSIPAEPTQSEDSEEVYDIVDFEVLKYDNNMDSMPSVAVQEVVNVQPNIAPVAVVDEDSIPADHAAVYTTAVDKYDLPSKVKACIVESISDVVVVRQVTIPVGDVQAQIAAYQAAYPDGCLAVDQAQWDSIQANRR